MVSETSLIRLATALAVIALLAPDRAQSQDAWLLGVEADVAIPALAPVSERFETGGAASVALYYAPTELFQIGLRARAGFLSDGPAPIDPTLANPGVGDLYGLGLSLRMRPLAPVMPGASRGDGLLVELGGGGVLTGGTLAPSAEGALGWGFPVDDVDLVPYVRWLTVFDLDGQLDGRPSHVLMAGLELTFFDRRDPPPEPEMPLIGDRDGDTILDDIDMCTEVPEDLDGFQDEDGCPEDDNDADGILDPDDRCPGEPEDHDGFMDEDGCPDPDNDHDGFPDVHDACPNEPEVINGVDDRDGCPDEGLITMIDDRIVFEDRVFFDFSRARIRREARPVLEAVVQLASQHPEWTRLRIEGHADIRGSREGNQFLSELRAQRIRDALVEAGIDESRIDAIGYGDTRPAVDAHSEAGHQLNRRVELAVIERRDLTDEERDAEAALAAEEREAARRAREPAVEETHE
ncbi:MAG: OmpA family protein [Sandaracinaceae bacterium]